MNTEAEMVARKWFDSIQKAIDSLKLDSLNFNWIKRDLEGGNMQICPVQVRARREGYVFTDDVCSSNGDGLGSLYGISVSPQYMARDTFEKVFGTGSLLPIDVCREDWPLSVPNLGESSFGWSYEFNGPGFFAVDPVVSGVTLGYMREEDYREIFPLFARMSDSRYKNRLCSNCIDGV